MNYNYYPQQPNYQPPRQQMPQPQNFTPPTIHADIIQVGTEQEALSFGVAAGTSQMFCMKDDSSIYIKTAYPNGQFAFTAFDRRPQTEPEQPNFVTYDDFERFKAEILSKITPEQPTDTKSKT